MLTGSGGSWLCCRQVRQPWLLSRLLTLAKNESYVRSQDFFQLCSKIAANPVGNPIVWNFLR